LVNLEGGVRPIKLEEIERMREIFGLNDPWYVAYWNWVANLLQGDLGDSLSRPSRVVDIIGQRIGPTLMLEVTALSLTYLLAIPIGLYATARSGRLDERIVSTLLYMLYSLPVFVAALLLQVLFAIQLRGTAFELSLFGMTSDNFDELSFGGKVRDLFQHALLPVVCFTYGSLAYYSRFIRANMQEVIRQDYIRTARAKGVGPVRVLMHHAFRNTLIPLVTMIGLTLPVLLSGSIILEQIFSWPGMGKLFFESIRERDYPTMMGLVLMFSVLTLLGQMLADFLYAVVDPRVTYH
jgi:peptide/nickel transport system permease protein